MKRIDLTLSTDIALLYQRQQQPLGMAGTQTHFLVYLYNSQSEASKFSNLL